VDTCNKFQTAFVTGASGFIGSALVDRLLSENIRVTGYDNLSTGLRNFITDARTKPNFSFIEGDVLDLESLTTAMRGADIVFHLSANADIRFGLAYPRRDLDQNTIATFNVLEAMRANGVSSIAFSSTGSVYGEAEVIPTPEDAPFPVQTSLYAASKLAGEGLIAAYCEGYAMKAYIFRFVSILGERYTHGHVFDFYQKLLANPTQLDVLGNGRQRKSYLYVHDCIDAMLVAIARSDSKVGIFNLGTDQHCEVNDSIGWIVSYLGLKPEIFYTGGKRGWVGDNPFIFLDTSRIRSLGWKPKLTIKQGVERTIAWLSKNRWVFDAR
jgi:UDP-glucose 4-epimerase